MLFARKNKTKHNRRGITPGTKRVKPAQKSSYVSRAENFRQERARLKKQESRDRILSFFKKYYRFFLGLSSILALLIIVFLASRYVVQTGFFRVQEIKVVGAEQLSVADVSVSLAEYMDRSLFSINAGEVSQKLKDEFSYIKEVYIRKQVPDKLEIEVVERYPFLSYVNMAGAYLVDREGVVVSVLDYEETVPLTADELAIIEGYIDPNSERIMNRYIEQLSPEEQEEIRLQIARQERLERQKAAAKSSSTSSSESEEFSASQEQASEDPVAEEDLFNWEEVPLKKKQSVIDDLRQEYQVRVDSRLERFHTAVENTGLKLINIEELSVDEYQKGEDFSVQQFNFMTTIKERFKEYGFALQSIDWRTSFNVRAAIWSGTEIVFTMNKSLEQQLAELAAVSRVQSVNRMQEVDLRGELIAVREN